MDNDDMFDRLVEIELRTYRAHRAETQDDAECWGTVAIVCNERNVYMGGGDTLDAAESDALTDSAVL